MDRPDTKRFDTKTIKNSFWSIGERQNVDFEFEFATDSDSFAFPLLESAKLFNLSFGRHLVQIFDGLQEKL
jgi:hypothetical protein